MKKLSLALAAASMATLSACGSSSSTPYEGFVQPANTVVVNLKVDDSINKVWKAGELAWKGEVQQDPTTRMMTYSTDWLASTPGWPVLYDDGPWDTKNATTGLPGHEPAGSVAGDHIWGIAGFFAKPAAGADVTINYGLGDPAAVDRNATWYWLGANPGQAIITSTSTVVNAPGQTFPAHGTYDLKLEIDMTALAGTGWVTDTCEVKGNKWGWQNKPCNDDGLLADTTAGDQKFTFRFSDFIDGTHPPYPGLLALNDAAEFVFVIGGVEYKVNGDASPVGVTASLKNGTGAWYSKAVEMTAPGAFGANTEVIVTP